MRAIIVALVSSLAFTALAARPPEPDPDNSEAEIAAAQVRALVEDADSDGENQEESENFEPANTEKKAEKSEEKDPEKKEPAEKKTPPADEATKAAVNEFSKTLSSLLDGAVRGKPLNETIEQLFKTLSAAQKMMATLSKKTPRPDPKEEDEKLKELIEKLSPDERKALIKKLARAATEDVGQGPAPRSSTPSPYAQRDEMIRPQGPRFQPGSGMSGGCSGGSCGIGGGSGTGPRARGMNDYPGAHRYGNAPGISGGFGSPGGSQRRFSGPRDPLPPSDAPFPRSELVPAGFRGNPSFEFMAEGERTMTSNGVAVSYQSCQGTPILMPEAPKDGDDESGLVCQFATAAHCVLTDSGRLVSKFNTADFGEFRTTDVKIMENHGYVGTDMAIVTFKGEACARGAKRKPEIKVAKLAETPLRSGDVVFAGTRYFGKLLYGQVRGGTNDSLEVDFDFKSTSGKGHQGGIHSGDSGGGLFSFDSEGNPVLHAVLSASTDESQTHFTAGGQPTVGGRQGYYSTALDFARRERQRAEALVVGGRARVGGRRT